jgi:hypothetical protein
MPGWICKTFLYPSGYITSLGIIVLSKVHGAIKVFGTMAIKTALLDNYPTTKHLLLLA